MDASRIDKGTGIRYYLGCIIKHQGGCFSNETYKVCKISDVRKFIKEVIKNEMSK